MARARNIKPSIMDNEDLAELEPLTRLLFIYLWMLADRDGKLEDRPKRIAAQALAYDRSADADKMLDSLAKAGFITRYTAQGVACIRINAFAKHQTPHVREAASSLPDKEESTTKAVPSTVLDNDETSPRSPDSLIPDSLIPDTNIKPSSAQKPRLDYLLDEFEGFWAAYPKRPGASKADALKAWKARIKEGCDQKAIIDGAKRYSAYCTISQIEPQFIKQPCTFLGPGKHFEADWTIQQPAKKEDAKPWFLSASGIESKAAELGVEQGDGEPFHAFKDRVYRAANLTAEAIRNAQKDWATA